MRSRSITRQGIRRSFAAFLVAFFVGAAPLALGGCDEDDVEEAVEEVEDEIDDAM